MHLHGEGVAHVGDGTVEDGSPEHVGSVEIHVTLRIRQDLRRWGPPVLRFCVTLRPACFPLPWSSPLCRSTSALLSAPQRFIQSDVAGPANSLIDHNFTFWDRFEVSHVDSVSTRWSMPPKCRTVPPSRQCSGTSRMAELLIRVMARSDQIRLPRAPPRRGRRSGVLNGSEVAEVLEQTLIDQDRRRHRHAKGQDDPVRGAAVDALTTAGRHQVELGQEGPLLAAHHPQRDDVDAGPAASPA